MKAKKIAAVVTCVAVTLSLTACNDKGRLEFGNQFVGYLNSRDYKSIQEHSTMNGYQFIKTSDVKTLVENSEFQAYAGKNLTFVKASYDKDTDTTTLKTEAKEEYKFKFIKSGDVYYWSCPEFYTECYNVYAPLGSKITVNGVTLGDEQYVEDDGVTVTYEIDRLPNLAVPVVITNPYFETINKTLNPAEDEDSPSVAVADETRDQILESMNEQFNIMYTTLTKDVTIEEWLEATGTTFELWEEEDLEGFLDKAKKNRKFDDTFVQYTEPSCVVKQIKDTDAVFVGENTIEIQLLVQSEWLIGDGTEGTMDTKLTLTTMIDESGWNIVNLSDWSWLNDLNSVRGGKNA